MKNFKKISLVLLMMVFLVVIAACGNEKGPSLKLTEQLVTENHEFFELTDEDEDALFEQKLVGFKVLSSEVKDGAYIANVSYSLRHRYSHQDLMASFQQEVRQNPLEALEYQMTLMALDSVFGDQYSEGDLYDVREVIRLIRVGGDWLWGDL